MIPVRTEPRYPREHADLLLDDALRNIKEALHSDFMTPFSESRIRIAASDIVRAKELLEKA